MEVGRSEEYGHTGTSKVQQYRWTIKDKPGVLLHIAKGSLNIDDSYQRDVKEDRVLTFARSWSWVACGAIIVACRGAEFYVIDGQHRVRAALKRADVSELPCIVFETDDVRQEAIGFYNANKNRRPLASAELYKAMLVAGDEAARFVGQLVSTAGRTPSHAAGATTVRCIGVLMSLARNEREPLEAVWPLVCQICEGQVLHERILTSLVFLESKLADEHGESLARARWKIRLLQTGYQGLLRAAAEATSYYARGGPKVWATGVLKVLNHGLRNKLVLKALADIQT